MNADPAPARPAGVAGGLPPVRPDTSRATNRYDAADWLNERLDASHGYHVNAGWVLALVDGVIAQLHK